MFRKSSAMENAVFFFFGMKVRCTVSCVKTKEGTNTLIFHIFERGAECSAESFAKYNFIIHS